MLQFSSAEVARILHTTPSAVNSALQRARKAVRERVPEKSEQAELDALGRNGSRNLVDAFMRAWERADVAALVDLLAKDARFTMPPLPAWFLGQGEIGRFFADRMFATPWRLLPLRANGGQVHDIRGLIKSCAQRRNPGGRRDRPLVGARTPAT